jgi:hypothetical protein
MPTIKKQDGFEVVINTRDEHLPPHVHVWNADGEVIINLGNSRTAPSQHEVNGMAKKDVKKALEIVTDNQRVFLKEWWRIWRQIHG